MIPKDCTPEILEVLRSYYKDECSEVSIENEATHLVLQLLIIADFPMCDGSGELMPPSPSRPVEDEGADRAQGGMSRAIRCSISTVEQVRWSR
jgi:hypothetical protein